MMWALLSLALAAPEPLGPIPAAPEPVPLECPRSLELVPGQPLPAGLVDAKGVVACRATVVPTSDVAHLLLIEAWAQEAEVRLDYDDVRLAAHLARERDLEALLDAERKPLPFWERPGTQRLVGRLETAAAVVLVGGLVIGLQAASTAAAQGAR